MVDITPKKNTLRQATAVSILKTSKKETIEAIRNRTVPKGDVLEFSRAAGFFGVKKTPELIPDCHPLPIESTRIWHEIHGLEIHAFVEVKTIYKTGVEVEAMHGASVVALTMYDMLKPLDKGIEIASVKLLEKTGGKSDYYIPENLSASVIISSDSIAVGKKEDKAGKAIVNKLQAYGIENKNYQVIPDTSEVLKKKINEEAGTTDLLIICGGTGLTSKDKTPETVISMLETEIPGIMEAARKYGQERTPVAFLSRGVAGMIGKTLVLAVPGSLNGARETMDALLPDILHVFKSKDFKPHSPR
ncbi:MAG: bifunctional molybdenum cofactor biosynthesis protein MoaC/MoaB [Cytophagaceae bacterium]